MSLGSRYFGYLLVVSSMSLRKWLKSSPKDHDQAEEGAIKAEKGS